MLLIAAAPAMASVDRRRYLAGLLGTLVAGGLAGTIVFGAGLWNDTVLAPFGTGRRGMSNLAGLLAQGLWNVGVLAALVAGAIVLRADARDRRLMGCATALALGACATGITLTKNGTGLYVMVGLEGAFLPLACCGALWLSRWRRWAAVVTAVAVILVGAQSLSLLTSPHRPRLFVRPGAPIGYAVALTDHQVRAAVAVAERCPSRLAYSGESYIAFLARRRMPGDQPDTYLIEHAPRLSAARRAAERETSRCP
jgi:hypothetical protein